MGESLLADWNFDVTGNERSPDSVRYAARFRTQPEVHPTGTVSRDHDPTVVGNPENQSDQPRFRVASREVHLPVDSLDGGVKNPEGRRRDQFDSPLVNGAIAVVAHADDQPVGVGVMAIDPVPDVDEGAGRGDDEVSDEGVVDGTFDGNGLSSPRQLSRMCGGLQ